MPSLAQSPRDPHVTVSTSDNLVDRLRKAETTITFSTRDGETRLTTDELFERARRRLAGLRERGLGPGDVVLLTTSRPDQFVTTYWACLLGGLIPAPLDANPDRIEAVRHAIQPALIVDDAQAPLLDGDSPPLIQPGEVAVLQFTSGSTSTPRPVRLSHANILADVRGMAAKRHGSAADTFVSWLPLFHDMGLIGYHLAPIALGARQVLLGPEQFARNPMSWLKALHHHRGTITGGPSSALSHLLKWAQRRDLSDLDLSQVHCWLVGAEPLSIDLLQETARVLAAAKLPSTALCPGYGLAEASLAVTMTPRQAPRARTVDRESLGRGLRVAYVAEDHPHAIPLVDCGSPIPGVSVRITHEDRTLPSGVVGCIEVSGPTVGGDPAPTWLRTGDLGLLDEGRLFVTGREKETFFEGGRTYYAHDIDHVVLERDDVRPHGAALAVSPANRHGVEKRTLFVALASSKDAAASLAQIAQHVAQRTGLVLDEIVAIGRADLPRTTSGKIRRHQLLELDGQGRFADAPRFRPARRQDASPSPTARRTDTLALVRRVWAAALELPVVGADDDFFALGGRSIIAAEILGRLEEELSRSLPTELLIHGTTPRKMAAWLDGPSQKRETLPVPVLTSAAPAPAPTPSPASVAVVGIALRLPSAQDPAGLWHILRDGRCVIRNVPSERFDAASFTAETGVAQVTGSFLDDLTHFDPEPFGLSDAMASALDPQQRLFLEVAHDALGQALVPSDRVGVFVASGDNEYALRYLGAPELVGPHALLGALKNMIPARVSSVFGLTGPSVAVDTACSSSLSAVHLAVRSLRSGECDVALAGGVQVNLTDQAWRYFAAARLLSTDGACRPFDRRAQGLVPGEGAIAVLLKPLAAAVQDRDEIWGVLRGTAMTNDGGAMSGTAPNPRGQREAIEKAWTDAGLDPATATYVETHAAGTALGDALEMESVARVFARAPSVRVGSIKSNLGHTFAVSGIAGLVKVLLSLRHEAIPPTLGCEEPAQRLPFSTALALSRALVAWPRQGPPRRAGVDSFGLGGTNVHVVVEEAPEPTKTPVTTGPTLYPVAAPHGALSRVALSQQNVPGSHASRAAGALRRARWGAERGAVVVDDDQGLDGLLAAVTPADRLAHRVALLVPGPGSQKPGMGRALCAREPAFGEAWSRCRAAFLAHGVDLDTATAEDHVDTIDAAQAAVFAYAYAAASWLTHLGLKDPLVLGHSGGELLAAHLAGVLSFEDCVSLVVTRGHAMARAPKGGLIAVFASESVVHRFVSHHALPVSISGVNAPEQTVVAGARGDLEAARAAFEAAGLAARIIPVTTPAHSPLMDGVATALRQALDKVELQAPTRPWISTLNGLAMGCPDLDHFARQIREPVRFVDAVETALARGIDAFVELAPTPGLTACVDAIANGRALAIPLGQRDESELHGTLHAIATLWSAGLDLRLDRLAAAQTTPARLPAWPWARRRLWIDAPTRATSRSTPVIDGSLPSIADHRTAGRATAPAALLLDHLLSGVKRGEPTMGLRRVVIENPLALAPGEKRRLLITETPLSVSTAPVKGGEATLHLRAELVSKPRRLFDRLDLDEIRRRCPREVTPESVYEHLRKTQFDVGPRLRAATTVHIGDGELIAELRTPEGGDSGQLIDPALLDGASQVLAALFLDSGAPPTPFLGFSMGSLSIWAPLRHSVLAVVQLRSRVEADTNVLRYDVFFCDPQGKLVAEVRDCSAKRGEPRVSEIPHSAPSPTPQSPRDDQVLAHLCREVATRVRRPVSSVSPDAGLARLGLDSLKAVELAAALEAHYGVPLPATLLFEVRTLREAARALRDLVWGEGP
jgi:acyl transferase domain-containing protein/acyl-CoA synthetase (AMP-forming)/AMP-acid ligase II/acyl carrier protein